MRVTWPLLPRQDLVTGGLLGSVSSHGCHRRPLRPPPVRPAPRTLYSASRIPRSAPPAYHGLWLPDHRPQPLAPYACRCRQALQIATGGVSWTDTTTGRMPLCVTERFGHNPSYFAGPNTTTPWGVGPLYTPNKRSAGVLLGPTCVRDPNSLWWCDLGNTTGSGPGSRIPVLPWIGPVSSCRVNPHIPIPLESELRKF